MLLQPPPLRSANYATARAEAAPFLLSSSKHQSSHPDDINPRSYKRRRADSGTSHDIAAADRQELCDFLLTNLPFTSGISAVRPHQQLCSNTSSPTGAAPASRHVPPVATSISHLDDVYSLAHERMIASVARSPTSATSNKFSPSSEYSPYHAQYWSIVENDLAAGTPLSSNGSYHSPYSSLAPEVFFPAVSADPSVSTYAASNHQNGYDHPDGSAYTMGRSTPFSACMPPETANVYPSPVDHFGWNYFSSVDLSLQSLSNLDNLASQVLNTMLANSVDDFATMVAHPETATGRVWGNLEAMFDQITGQFPHDSSSLFIDINQLQLGSTTPLTAVRKANLALFATSIFRGRDVPFMDLDTAFLDIFMPSGTCLLKDEGSLFLELKTQAFIAMTTSHNYPRELVDQLFPRDLQLRMLRRRAEPQHLAATEQDFIGRYNARRQFLIACYDDMETLSQLPSKYSWNNFLSELRTCAGRNLEYLERTKAASSAEDPITKAALAAHAAISGHSPSPYASPSLLQIPNFGHKRKRSPVSDSPLSPESPHAPIHLHYRYSSQGAKSSSPFSNGVVQQRRLASTPSTRRPWTPEEEKALMDGLERVKGPHWSQILALYGIGGSISEILKDRNQVQLKDKARNLKLFFLKSGLDVPYFLQKVTGELKTRAPAQAAKLEARERLKRLEEQKSGRGMV